MKPDPLNVRRQSPKKIWTRLRSLLSAKDCLKSENARRKEESVLLYADDEATQSVSFFKQSLK